jgi:polyhydroxybutyrate depolymerase
MRSHLTTPHRSTPGRSARRLASRVAMILVAGLVGIDAQTRGGTATRIGNGSEHLLTHGGRARTYLVHDYGRGRPAPMMVVLHGGGGNAGNAVEMTGMNRLAAREGLLVVYPNGTASRDRGRLLTWNAGHCCASAMTDAVDDVGFLAAVIDTLVRSGRADASRVYLTGMSNGAMLAHRFARERSSMVAGIAPVVGAVFGDEPPPRGPVRTIVMVGADDRTVPADGGPLQLRALLGRQSAADHAVAPAIDQATYWARHNGCGEPARRTTAAAATYVWNDCRSGAPVEFHSVAGHGHAWPGGRPGRRGADAPATGFDATEEMWRFFTK